MQIPTNKTEGGETTAAFANLSVSYISTQACQRSPRIQIPRCAVAKLRFPCSRDPPHYCATSAGSGEAPFVSHLPLTKMPTTAGVLAGTLSAKQVRYGPKKSYSRNVVVTTESQIPIIPFSGAIPSSHLLDLWEHLSPLVRGVLGCAWPESSALCCPSAQIPGGGGGQSA